MDIRLTGNRDGVQAAEIIKSELGIDVLFISGHADEALLDRAKVVEPLGYIHKPFSEQQIAAALKLAFHQIKRKRICSKPATQSPPQYENFTSSEIRVAQLLKQAKSTTKSAAILEVSPSTVIWHRKNIRKKLGIADTKKDLLEVLMCNPT